MTHLSQSRDPLRNLQGDQYIALFGTDPGASKMCGSDRPRGQAINIFLIELLLAKASY